MKKILMLKLLSVLLVSTIYVQPAFADKIVIFGASGQFGSHLVQEALDRGHQVIGVSRSPEKFDYTDNNFTPVKGNPTVIESVSEIVKGVDSIVVALGDREAETPETTAMNLAAIALTTVLDDQGKDGPPVIVLGGGNTSAETEEGMLDILAERGGENNPRLKQIFLSQWVTYQTYLKSDINWTYVATPRYVLGAPNGDPSRTGKYRSAIDGSLDKEADTALSRADIALAMIDFAETGQYTQMRVGVAQE